MSTSSSLIRASYMKTGLILLITFCIILGFSASGEARKPGDTFPLTESQEYANCQFLAHGVYRTLLNKAKGYSKKEAVSRAKSIDSIYPQSLNYKVIEVFEDFYGNSYNLPSPEGPFAYSINAFQVCLENFMDRFPVSLFMLDEQAKTCATRGLILGDIYRHYKSKGKQGTIEYYRGNIPDYLLPIIGDRLDYLQMVDDGYTGGSIAWLYYALMSAEALNCYDESL